MSDATEEKTTVRDARVDQIGFVKELDDQYVKDLKTGVKSSMVGKDAVHAEGDFFEATLGAAGTVQTINPVKFYNRFKRGDMSEKDFIRSLKSIDRGVAEEFMSGRDIDTISETREGSRALTVRRKKGVVVKLIEALRGLAASIKDDQ
ncbi:hypothetical protein BH09PLA1_BH09PLA1_25970 [soil metagenome]